MSSTAAPAPESFRCPSCAAALPAPDTGSPFVRCDHCGTTSVVDLAGALRHLACEPRVRRRDVPGILRAAGAAEAASIERVWHPFWEFAHGGRTLAVDAAPDHEPTLDPLRLPAGRRVQADALTADADPTTPSLVPEAAATLAADHLRATLAAEDAVLVHVPLYRVTARDGATLWIDALEGAVLARHDAPADAGASTAPTSGGGGTRPVDLIVLAAAAATFLLPPAAAVAAVLLLAGYPALRDVARS